jgi:hypothetical protein
MRRVLVILVGVLAVALGAGLYVWFQPATPQVVSTAPPIPALTRPAATTTASTNPSGQIFHTGGDVWAKVFDVDKQTGRRRVAWQFRASRYDPQPDNSIVVDDPQAEFFFTDGQVLTL